eukprot:COSAG06_NODE_24942_length_648_cov_15.899818_2_plen_32_part_01
MPFVKASTCLVDARHEAVCPAVSIESLRVWLG